MDRDNMTNSKFQASQMPIKQRIQQIDVSALRHTFHILMFSYTNSSFLCIIVEHQGGHQMLER